MVKGYGLTSPNYRLKDLDEFSKYKMDLIENLKSEKVKNNKSEHLRDSNAAQIL